MLGLIIVAAATLTPLPAHAVPAFAIQTGQPCQSCHVGGYGPQLTAFGRDFKMHGYTARAADSAPISMMAVASYLRTQSDQSEPPAPHYSTNDNVTLDQASLFFAGGWGGHFGAFVQTTYDGVGHIWSWDNIDIRATTTATLGHKDVVLGLSLNNSPTNTDPWNSLPAWGFPFTDSGLAPSPAASPLIAGALAQNVIGLNAYAWWNSSIYAEGGLYWSPNATFLNRVGVSPADTSEIHNRAPYVRLAWVHDVGPGSLEVGGFGLFADLFPGRDRTTGTTDRYRDMGVDASYQLPLGAADVLTIEGRYTHEQQKLSASQALGLAANHSNTLNDLRVE
jgi:hypothetical protein